LSNIFVNEWADEAPIVSYKTRLAIPAYMPIWLTGQERGEWNAKLAKIHYIAFMQYENMYCDI